MNLANLLTASRLFLTVPIVLLMYTPGAGAAWTAFGLFVLAMLTDVFAGASPSATRTVRRWGTTSTRRPTSCC